MGAAGPATGALLPGKHFFTEAQAPFLPGGFLLGGNGPAYPLVTGEWGEGLPLFAKCRVAIQHGLEFGRKAVTKIGIGQFRHETQAVIREFLPCIRSS